MSLILSREIDTGYRPPVKGIDLEQALNYIDLDDVSKEFIHVVSEVLLPDIGWLLVDPSFGLLFMNNEIPIFKYL